MIYIFTLNNGNATEFEEIPIKAYSKNEAWGSAQSIAFSDLFSTCKMIYIVEPSNEVNPF